MKEKWNKDHCEVRDYLVAQGFSCENTMDHQALNVYRYGMLEFPKRGFMPVRTNHFVIIFGDPYGNWQFVEPFSHGGHGKYDLEKKISLLFEKENYFRFFRLDSEQWSYWGKVQRPYSHWLEYVNQMRSVGALPRKVKNRVSNQS